MSSRDEERVLWKVGEAECVMVSCCAGAELQVRLVRLKADATNGAVSSVRLQPDVEIVLRELYPMKSDLYERARELEAEYGLSRSHEGNEEHEDL